MKKIILYIILLLVLIIIVIAIKINDNTQKMNNITTFNEQFETIYKDKTLYGADVLTVINKAIDNNKIYNIEKDNNGNYIDDNNYCLKVDLILLSTDEEGKIHELEYPMEALQKAGLDGFISSFSLTAFECSEVNYNAVRTNIKNYIKTTRNLEKSDFNVDIIKYNVKI